MSSPRSDTPAGFGSGNAVVDGVDVDAVAAAVRACPGVEALYSSKTASVASYLPGRQVAGVRVAADAVTVQVRTAWAVPFPAVAARIQLAVAALGGGRRVDVVVADIADAPPPTPSALTTTTAASTVASTEASDAQSFEPDRTSSSAATPPLPL